MPYGVGTHVLTNNRAQIISKLFESLCAFVGTKHLRTAMYHSQTNRQAELISMKIIPRLRHYVAKHQRDL